MDDLRADSFAIKEGPGEATANWEAKPNRGARKKSKVNDVM
jgi:hypothetical protein